MKKNSETTKYLTLEMLLILWTILVANTYNLYYLAGHMHPVTGVFQILHSLLNLEQFSCPFGEARLFVPILLYPVVVSASN